MIYIGDGGNDFCPLNLLNENDFVFARNGYSLQKRIEKRKKELNASVEYWDTGFDIIRKLQSKKLML